MASIISVGVSFLVFFIVLGFMWLIGIHLLSNLFDVIDKAMAQDVIRAGNTPEAQSWVATKDSLKSNIQLIMLWAVPILMLFASIRMLANAGGQGRE